MVNVAETLRCPVCKEWLDASDFSCHACGCMGQVVTMPSDAEVHECMPVTVNHQLIESRYRMVIENLKSKLDTSVIVCDFSKKMSHELQRDIEAVCIEYSMSLSELEAGILKQRVFDEMLGWGPLSDLLRDPDIQDIFVNSPDEVLVSKSDNEQMITTEIRFEDDYQLKYLVQRIAHFYSNQITEPVNLVLPNGSRFFAALKRPRDVAPMIVLFKSRQPT